MSNLTKRILSSVLFVMLIIAPLYVSGRVAYTVYVLLGAFTLKEVLKLSTKTGAVALKPISLAIYTLTVVLIYQLAFEHAEQARLTLIFLGMAMLGTFLSEIFRKNPHPFESVAVGISAPLFISLSFSGIIYFLAYREDLPQPGIIVAIFSLIWINDSAAYLLGRKIGKRKLFERISPNKTIEGSLAGLLTSMAAGAGISQINGMPSLWIMIGLAVVCVFSGSLGDLFESRIKRAAGVKDSGVFLPGHGGFFDRFDAMMFAIPSSILFFETLLPKS